MRWKARSPPCGDNLGGVVDGLPFLAFSILSGLGKSHGRSFARRRTALSVWFFWLLHTISWWRFLGFFFLLFSSKKVRDAPAQLHFHYWLPKLCRPYLIPRNETIIASSCHVDLCPILVIKGGNLCRPLTFMALISYCKSPLSLDSKRAEETWAMAFVDSSYLFFFYIRISHAPSKLIYLFFVQLIGGVCLFCNLSRFTYTKFRLLCLRGSPCNLAESIPEE